MDEMVAFLPSLTFWAKQSSKQVAYQGSKHRHSYELSTGKTYKWPRL